jgi:hypothetical protein
MNRVKIATSDAQIWDLQQVTFNLLKAALLGPVKIDLAHEGPCCNTSGLDNLLDHVCQLLDLPPEHFVINTSNQLASSRYPENRTMFVELETAQSRIGKYSISTLEKRFGIFIGRSNTGRFALASYLHQHHRSQTEMTFHYDPTHDFHINNFGLEEFLQKHWDSLTQAFEFLPHLPVRHDVQSYPILWNKAGFDLGDQYAKIFCDIVCETFCTGRTFFVTEKTLRCIINKRPFVVQGPRHYLKNLQLLGFKTFANWWDEGYDSDPEDSRYQGIVCNINWIADQDSKTIQRWYTEMQSILEHNVQVLQHITNQQILKTKFYYE